MTKIKKIPVFKSEEEEQEFWATHDSSEFVDWKKSAKAVFPRLKPSTKTISLRLPEHLIEDLKMMAQKRDVPYQSLIKILLKERLDKEFRQAE
jgi:predicted DNA binding CopG/RHH family protein